MKPTNAEMPKLLPVGTRIHFLQTLSDEATEDRPACLFAIKGDGGIVTAHGSSEGHWVRWDKWPNSFGAEYGTEFIEEVEACECKGKDGELS